MSLVYWAKHLSCLSSRCFSRWLTTGWEELQGLHTGFQDITESLFFSTYEDVYIWFIEYHNFSLLYVLIYKAFVELYHKMLRTSFQKVLLRNWVITFFLFPCISWERKRRYLLDISETTIFRLWRSYMKHFVIKGEIFFNICVYIYFFLFSFFVYLWMCFWYEEIIELKQEEGKNTNWG